MPARIDLSVEAIRDALEATGGNVAAAATRLGVSTKTLRRRLAADPGLKLGPPVDPIWQRALHGNAAIRDGSDPRMAGDNPFVRYINILEGVGGWYEVEERAQPRVLSALENSHLLPAIQNAKDSWIMVNARYALEEHHQLSRYQREVDW